MNTKEFHITTTKELLALKDRVRHLIDHWGEEGRYKEAVLKSIIERFLPSKYKIATGFAVKSDNYHEQHLASTQIDLLVYETSFPVLFKEADFVIVTADSVRAIIEVKANLKNRGLPKVIKKANEMGRFIFDSKRNTDLPFFNGVFSFEGYDTLTNYSILSKGIIASASEFLDDPDFARYRVNHISFNKDLFYKFWSPDIEEHLIYKISDLSFSFFIGNLMDYLSGESVTRNNPIWFPIDKSLEVKKRF